MKTLTKEQKDKWVAALRSGEYKQGKGYLHENSSNTYCCLGVLCETLEFERIEGCGQISYYIDSNGEYFNANLYDTYNIEENYLIDLNDEAHASFTEIADWIEEKVVTAD